MNNNTVGRMIALSIITATTIHATNGDNLIGIGAKSRGMGGTGIGISHGAESGLANPSLITSVEGTEISFGGTLFLPDIDAGFVGAPSYTSDMDVSTIPEVSIAHQINENWYIGIGIWGTAGLGVDYSQAPFDPAFGNINMVTNLQLLQFAAPIAYKTGGLSVGITPIMQYGNLDINYHLPSEDNPPYENIGAGIAQHYGFGYSLGISYDFQNNGLEGLLIGAMYKSKIKMEYKGIFAAVTQPFQKDGFPDVYSGDKLNQPAEFGVGISYTFAEHTLAFDYKKIQWSNAKGYGEFGWEDQNVFAFGYQYAQDNWAVRAGYNYADSTVVEQQDPRLNLFNLLGFPATAESHYTIGMSYGFTDKFSLDMSYVFQPKTTKTFNIAGLFPAQEFTVDHQENSATFQLTYKF